MADSLFTSCVKIPKAAADSVVRLAGNGIPWGLWVDEPNRLLFAAVPLANAVSVVDLDTLTHVADVRVGACPYAVAVDPVRRRGVVSNQGTPTENATASILDMCSVYEAAGRVVDGCSVLDTQRRRRPSIPPRTVTIRLLMLTVAQRFRAPRLRSGLP